MSYRPAACIPAQNLHNIADQMVALIPDDLGFIVSYFLIEH
jgi:hypothetical protein